MPDFKMSFFSFLVDWCRFGSDHTMCKYTGISPTCNGVTDRGDDITGEEKATVVNKHNEYRRKVAAGEVGGLPKASSMPVLVKYYIFYSDNISLTYFFENF